MKFRKFHVTLHYPTFIKRYGAPALGYAGWFEKALRFLVKVPYLRTGRRVSGTLHHVTRRISLAEASLKKKAALERECPGTTLSCVKVELPSGKKVFRLQKTPAGGVGDENEDGDTAPFRKSSWDNTGYTQWGDE